MDILFPGSNLENKQQNYRFYDRNPYVDSKQHKFISQIMESVYVFGIKLKTEVASETEIAQRRPMQSSYPRKTVISLQRFMF